MDENLNIGGLNISIVQFLQNPDKKGKRCRFQVVIKVFQGRAIVSFQQLHQLITISLLV
jgi:hypothetical protein